MEILQWDNWNNLFCRNVFIRPSLLTSSCRSMFEADLAVSVVSFSFINNSLCFGMFNVYTILITPLVSSSSSLYVCYTWDRIPFVARCTRYSIMWYSLSVTCVRSVVGFSEYSGFLHQNKWLPRYNWNIVESSVSTPSTKTKPFYIYLSNNQVFYETNDFLQFLVICYIEFFFKGIFKFLIIIYHMLKHGHCCIFVLKKYTQW